MLIELVVVADCPHEQAAADLIATALHDLRMHDAEVTRTLVESHDEAVRRGFVGSPTILIDGVDPFGVSEALPGLACRVYATADGLRSTPTLPEMRRALKVAAAGSDSR